jgi:hypothetical protein
MGGTKPARNPGVVFWATVGLVAVLVAYPLSFGPVFWLHEKGMMPD